MIKISYGWRAAIWSTTDDFKWGILLISNSLAEEYFLRQFWNNWITIRTQINV